MESKAGSIIVVGADSLFPQAPYRYIQENPVGAGLLAGISAAK
jgi:hypothetical protein